MQRYFITKEQLSGNEIILDAEAAHHIKNVMRRKSGDIIYCVLPPNRLIEAEILSFQDKAVRVAVVHIAEETHELPVTVTVAQGLPKGEKADWVLQKGTELGMTNYVPLQMERNIVKLDGKKEQKRLERWNKIVKEAAEQSYRSQLPEISPIQNLEQLIVAYADYEHKLIAYEEEAKQNPSQNRLKQILTRVVPNERVIMVFGPEGGIAEREIELLKTAGYIPCALGPRILRTETAPLYFLSVLSYTCT